MSDQNDNNKTTATDRAIIFATSVRVDQHSAMANDYAHERPGCLMPLADKPAIQHVLENVVRLGVRTVDVVMSDGADQIESLIGDGSRWGIEIQFHLVTDGRRPYGILGRQLSNDGVHRVVIVHAEEFPAEFDIASGSSDETVVFCHNSEWTGAAVLTNKNFTAVDTARMQWTDLSEDLFASANESGSIVEAAAPLCVADGESLLQSQRRLLNGEFPALIQHLRTAESGVWIGRNTRLHPTARIMPPVLIGSNCDIGRRTDIGPNAILGDSSIVEQDVTITDSLVMPFSGVGEALELCDVIVSGHRVFNARIGAAIDLNDNRLLGDLRSHSIRSFLSTLSSRLIGLFLIALTWPLQALVSVVLRLFGRAIRHERYAVVRTPAPDAEFLWQTVNLRRLLKERSSRPGPLSQWRDLFTRIIPGLSAVVRGRIRLAGLTPRSAAEHQDIPEHWQSLLLKSPTGLISEPLVQYGPDADPDRQCTADIWYSVSTGRFRKLRLLGRYLKTLIVGPLVEREQRFQQNSIEPHTDDVPFESDSKQEVPDVEYV